MNQQRLQTLSGFGGSGTLAADRNRVLRNTYWLLALSMVPTVLGLSNGASLIMVAFAGTGAIFLGMASISTVIKRDLSAMGKWLFIGAIMLLVAGIANFFIQSSALMITLMVLAIGIFSAFILYDLKRVRDGEETNYITATLGVYLSLYNVFQSLLALLGISGGNSD
jgi:modulator of FtsH protease